MPRPKRHLVTDPKTPVLNLQITFSVDESGSYSGLDLSAKVRDDLDTFLCEGCYDKLNLLLYGILGSVRSQISYYTCTEEIDNSQKLSNIDFPF